MATKFESELRELINRHSLENGSNTPDFAIAQYLSDCLVAYNKAVRERIHHIGNSMTSFDCNDRKFNSGELDKDDMAYALRLWKPSDAE